jgi:hypothetical protein
MTEIPITGLKGLYNRINLRAVIQQKDVVDVTVFIDEKLSGSSLATNRVMITTMTERMMNTGRSITPMEFFKILDDNSGMIITKEEYETIRQTYQPEFNVVTNTIGEGHKKIGNTVMLLARADNHIKTGQDLFLYEYIQMLLLNGSMKEK